MLKRASVKTLVAFVMTAVLSVFSNVSFSQNEILIGTECGPAHILDDDGLIHRDHDVFVDSGYFYSTISAADFDYSRSVPTKLWHKDWLWQDDHYLQHARHYSDAGIRALMYPGLHPLNINGDPYHPNRVWKIDRDRGEDNGGELIFQEDFFSMFSDGDFFSSRWEDNDGVEPTYKNFIESIANPDVQPDRTNKFMIGNKTSDSNNLDDNWVKPYDYTGAFYPGGGVRQPIGYRLSLLIRKLDEFESDELICLYVKTGLWRDYDNDGEKDVDEYQISFPVDNSDIGTDWDWLHFDIDSVDTDKIRFALKWNGDYDGGDGKVRIAKIQYEGQQFIDVHTNVDAEGYSTGDFGGAYWIAGVVGYFQGMRHWFNELGFMCPEPFPRAYYGFKKVKNALDGTFHSQAVSFGSSAFTAQYPAGLSKQGAQFGNFIDETGVEALWFDFYPFQWGVHPDSIAQGNIRWPNELSVCDRDQGTEEDIEGRSIQQSWQYACEGYYDYPGFCRNEGYRQATEAARNKGVKLHLGIQSMGELKKDNNGDIQLNGYAEPTPRMVRCLSYIAATFRPDGFFYSYYGPRVRGVAGNNFWFEPPIHATGGDAHERFIHFNGASISGLLTICHNNQAYDDTVATQAEFNNCGSAGNQNGWLRPNLKWHEAKAFAEYMHGIQSVYARLSYDNSNSAAYAPNNKVGRVTINSTSENWPHGGNTDGDSMHVQIGAFNSFSEDLYYFMLVNRRVDEDGGRWVDCTVDFESMDNTFWGVYLSNAIALYPGDTDFTDSYNFQYFLDPGEGRLFLIRRGQEGLPANPFQNFSVRGTFVVDDDYTVPANITMTVLPGSNLILQGDLYVNGRIIMAGKEDANGDSVISCFSIDGNRNGVIHLNGPATDTLKYVNMLHLDKALDISRSGGVSGTYIEHCEFAYNKNEGLKSSGEGSIKIKHSKFHDNLSDGTYVYNTKAYIDTCEFFDNKKNGLFVYSVNSVSTITGCKFNTNGDGSSSYPNANVFFYNCSPMFV